MAVLSRPADQDTEDRDLVAGVRAGDDRAFEVLYTRYQSRIAAYVGGMVRDRGRAEDITQDVFVSALRRMRETEREIVFRPWIYEIAKNACIDAYRRTRVVDEISFDARDAVGEDEHDRLAKPRSSPDAAIEDKVAIDNLCGAFGGLSPAHRDILVLREFDGLTYREIGDRLGLSGPAVESTLFRARKRLTEEYEELVSGERCRRVQEIVAATGAGEAGLRDRRRMARHLAHCQPCRRHARLAGLDLGQAPAATGVGARIAGFVPLPAFLRWRWASSDAAAPAAHSAAPVAQWSANVASVVDPGVASGWAKAVATAATVAVAGVGAGSAIPDRDLRDQFGFGGAGLRDLPRSAADTPRSMSGPGVKAPARRTPARPVDLAPPAAERSTDGGAGAAPAQPPESGSSPNAPRPNAGGGARPVSPVDARNPADGAVARVIDRARTGTSGTSAGAGGADTGADPKPPAPARPHPLRDRPTPVADAPRPGVVRPIVTNRPAPAPGGEGDGGSVTAGGVPVTAPQPPVGATVTAKATAALARLG